MDENAKKLLRDITSLSEDSMRLERLRREFEGLRPVQVVRLLSSIYKSHDHQEGARTTLSLLAGVGGLKGLLGLERYRLSYLEAEKLGLGRISALFTDLSAVKNGAKGYEREENSPMELVELGRRRSMSKGFTRDTLQRLLLDPDPVVITNLLGNPRITQREVLKITSRRPNSKEILEAVATHRKWSKNYNVRKALVMNPYTPPRLSVALLETLLSQDISLVADDDGLHPQVKLAAVEIIKEAF